MSIDLQAWLWFAFRLGIYTTIISMLVVGLLAVFIVWYYWFVVRRRARDERARKSKEETRSFVFHTLSVDISPKGLINVQIQRSPVEKKLIEFAQLNEHKYQIRSLDVNDERVEIEFEQSNTRLTIEHEQFEQKSSLSNRSYFVREYTFSWSSPNYRSRFHDKIHLADTGYWYGGATQRTVYWPINQFVTRRQAVIPQDAYKNMFGNVCERYWLSSLGLALFVDPLVPLFVSMDKKHLDFISEYRTPYRQRTNVPHRFQFKLLQHVNMSDLHLTMINRHLGKPTQTPDQRMIVEPIWSTWAQFKQNINTEKVLNFAEEIVRRNFPRSQLCIDDDWTPRYGVFDFDTAKFPNPKQMITKLKELNFRVTLWVHPFVSCRSLQFVHYWRRGFLIPLNIFSSSLNLLTERSRFLQVIFDDFVSNPQYQPLVQLIQMLHQRFLPSLPGISLWWNGLAGVLDFSNVAVQQEYTANLQRLKQLYDIDSFKFDAGEVNWLPITGSLANPSCQAMSTDRSSLVTSPALYPHLYAQLAHRIDTTNRLQEVRVGYRTQTLPMFVRIIDKDSDWSYSNGLRSLLPSIFNLGLLGYPFILPDMVGGNGYGLTITQTRLPQRELYIRWLQLNVLLPAIQFSFPPWVYEDEQVVRIAQRCLDIRERFRTVLLAAAEESVENGSPMVRPLWFHEPYNVNAQLCDSQYMLGSKLMVAPVLDDNVEQLKIYFPEGQWKCIHTDRLFEGHQSHTLPVTIEDIPIFERC